MFSAVFSSSFLFFCFQYFSATAIIFWSTIKIQKFNYLNLSLVRHNMFWYERIIVDLFIRWQFSKPREKNTFQQKASECGIKDWEITTFDGNKPVNTVKVIIYTFYLSFFFNFLFFLLPFVAVVSFSFFKSNKTFKIELKLLICKKKK